MPYPSPDPIYQTFQLDRINRDLCRVKAHYRVDEESDDQVGPDARVTTVRWNAPTVVRIEVEGREMPPDAFAKRFGPDTLSTIESDLRESLNP